MSQKTLLDNGVLKKGSGPHDLEFPSSKDFFSLPSNLITNLSGVSGGRVLLGSKGSLQAIGLVNREVPLVQSAATTGDVTFHTQFGQNLLSIKASSAGTVLEVTENEITIKDKAGKLTRYSLYNHFNLGRKSFVHNYPQVKVGDHVNSEQLIASSNFTDDKGVLALGTNLKTAVMPYRSGNFEDAWVVSESGAKKLEAEQLIKFRVEKKFGIDTNKLKYTTLFTNKYLNSQLNNLDNDGVVKKGAKLHMGDPVILAYVPNPLKSTDLQLGKLSKVLRNAYKDLSQTWDFEHPGEVVDVSKTESILTIQVKTKRSLQVGDKVSNVWGAKGVVGSIISDAQAPTTSDGKPVDLLLNSMSITSRVAPGLAISLGMGKLAEKSGKAVVAPHFTSESAIHKIISDLKKEGISDTEKLYDPVTGQTIQALTGPLYFTRLTHIAEDKQSSRSQGIGYSWDMQPTKAEDESSKRIGNLGTAALLSHGATAVLKDIATIKATKNDDYWRRLKLGLPPPSPQVPFIFNKFISHMQGAGIKVDKKGDVFNILPMTNKDVEVLSTGAIKDAGMYKIKGAAVTPEEGGLFDTKQTGILGDRWNHIDLANPIPNPISEDFLRKLFNVTKADFNKMVVSGKVLDEMKNLNLDQKIQEYTNYLKTGKKTKRDDAVKVLSFLKMLQRNDLHTKDLILTKIPVIPVQYRPFVAQEGLSLTADVNHLYKDLILNTKSLKNSTHVPQEVVDRQKLDQYNAVKSIYGLGEPITAKNKEKGIKGLLSTTFGTKGGSGKTTMFQAKVVNKPLDLVGRAVLTPDTKLGLDEASVPQDILWKTYSPFIIRRLVQRGVPAVKALEYIQARNPLAVEGLNEELKHRPGIISRDPSLHKFNFTGFYLKPNADPKDKTLKLNPLVFKSFNADNDGDQLNINIPASEQARQEVIDKMLPSKNLLSPKNFGPVYQPSNEAALGLFQASTENNKNKPIKFATEADAIRAFDQGKVSTGDVIEIG